MTTHYLKCWPEFFNEIVAGRKRHDLRKRDKSFRVGDLIILREWFAGQFTGREHRVVITYITDSQAPCAYSGDALHEQFCILSIAPEEETRLLRNHKQW